MSAVMHTVVEKKLDISDVLYHSPSGPIMVQDVIYGYGKKIAESGEGFFAHKTGFTQKSLINILRKCGFQWVYTGTGDLEIKAIALISKPNKDVRKLFNIKENR